VSTCWNGIDAGGKEEKLVFCFQCVLIVCGGGDEGVKNLNTTLLHYATLKKQTENCQPSIVPY
jgi:hypothetical protein